MSNKLFGTDGTGGRANAWPMTPVSVLHLGRAAAVTLCGPGTRIRC